ncbi:MAG: GmrSD restriction endonuclease domain-containing protein [Pseudonocardiaceae bacterium]
MRVPTFQRQFVWGAKDVRDLFDSLYRGFPVGTLLLWSQEAPAATVALGPIEFRVPKTSNAFWVVDGQQRITSLFAALSPSRKGVDARFEIYFDLATEKFINPRRGAAPPRSIPVREALETRSLLHWIRRNSDELENDDLDLADRLGGALRDYRIPAYIVSGDNQSLLREVFDRVNSAGKPISRAQVFHALFAGDENPGSPVAVVRELRRLRFGDLDESRIVQSLLALRGGDVQRDIRSEFDDSNNKDSVDWFYQTEQALTRSIEFLRSEGVRHLLLMPDTLPIPVLAAFFHLHPDPEPWTLRLLARWLWRGWVHGFGRDEGGQTPTLRRAIRAVNPEFRNPSGAPTEFEAVRSLLRSIPDSVAPPLPLDNFRTNFANTRLILLALASLRPRQPDDTIMDIEEQLEVHGVDAISAFVREHRTHAAARGFWPIDAEPVVNVRDVDVLESHALQDGAVRALRAGAVSEFLERRGKYIEKLTANFLNSRLESGSLVRPPLNDLILAGAAEEESD